MYSKIGYTGADGIPSSWELTLPIGKHGFPISIGQLKQKNKDASSFVANGLMIQLHAGLPQKKCRFSLLINLGLELGDPKRC
jgi:hypothetical protein